jgi:F-box/WD-40 domain protein 4
MCKFLPECGILSKHLVQRFCLNDQFLFYDYFFFNYNLIYYYIFRYVVKDGLLVSGGCDRTLVCWDSVSGEFLFSKRYCHGSEVSAVDVVRADYSQQTIVTGSRDGTAKLWTLGQDAENQMRHSNMNSINNSRFHRHQHHYDNFPALETTIHLGDRIWSLAVDPSGSRIAIGSAGLGGVPALHLLDLEIAGVAGSLVPMGEGDLRKGAGMLDLKWHTDHMFLGCGYDAYTRLWDTRTMGYVM